jgi:hypothetical protein
MVDVRPEAALAWQSDSTIIVKIRLAPGMKATVWADQSCGSPSAIFQTISASGAIAIDLASIDGAGKALVCLSSSDGRISTSLATLR